MKGRDFGVASGCRHAFVVQISKQISAVFSRDFDTLRAFSKDNETSGASPRNEAIPGKTLTVFSRWRVPQAFPPSLREWFSHG